MANRQCSATTLKGAPCKGIPIHGNQWCVAHHPDHQEQRRRGSKKGGRRGGRGRTGPSEVRELQHEIRAIVGGALSGRVEKGVASVAFMGYNVLLRSVEVERRLIELGELEERVGELEAIYAEQKELCGA